MTYNLVEARLHEGRIVGSARVNEENLVLVMRKVKFSFQLVDVKSVEDDLVVLRVGGAYIVDYALHILGGMSIIVAMLLGD